MMSSRSGSKIHAVANKMLVFQYRLACSKSNSGSSFIRSKLPSRSVTDFSFSHRSLVFI